jgi:hypothetical protein
MENNQKTKVVVLPKGPVLMEGSFEITHANVYQPFAAIVFLNNLFRRLLPFHALATSASASAAALDASLGTSPGA